MYQENGDLAEETVMRASDNQLELLGAEGGGGLDFNYSRI
jgi:hypothetical protein